MKISLLFVLFIVLVLAAMAVAVATTKKKKRQTQGEKPKKKRLLTQREEAMFNRLRTALPANAVLAQVSFGALITAKSRPVRNTFDRKIADFVVCNQTMEVLAVIELDDSSHKGKEEQDQLRDELLQACGYKVLRYKNIPDIAQVQNDFA